MNRFNKDDTRYEGINLPKPPAGNLIYTPAEAVATIMSYTQSEPKPPSRSNIRSYKEKMIAEKVVPVSISQLNYSVKMHGGPNSPPAPKCWNLRGAEEIISIVDLVKMISDSQMIWGIDQTRDALWAEKKGKRGSLDQGVKQPDRKTVNAYHTALLSIPEVAHKIVKSEAHKPGPKVKN